MEETCLLCGLVRCVAEEGRVQKMQIDWESRLLRLLGSWQRLYGQSIYSIQGYTELEQYPSTVQKYCLGFLIMTESSAIQL